MTISDEAANRLNKLLRIEQERDKKLYSKHVLNYYSPFDGDEMDQFDNYSYHIYDILDEAESVEQGTIGNFIDPSEPYPLVENDIIMEFNNDSITVFRTEIQNNVIKLVQKAHVYYDNIFLVTYVKTLLRHNIFD